jgi:hypothetical protein
MAVLAIVLIEGIEDYATRPSRQMKSTTMGRWQELS